MRTMSAAIQFLGSPVPEKRPWTITKSPSATINPGSYFQRRPDALDQIEEARATRLDVRAMLDVLGRPIAFGRHVITLVEQGIERLEDERLVFRWSRLLHVVLLIYQYLEPDVST